MLFNVGVTGGAGFLGEVAFMLAAFFAVCLLAVYVFLAALKEALQDAGVPLIQACIPVLGIYFITKKTGGSFFRWLLGHILYVIFALICVLSLHSDKLQQFYAAYGIIVLIIGYIVALVGCLLILYMIIDSIRLDTYIRVILGFDLIHLSAFFLLCYYCIPGLRGFLAGYGLVL